MAFLDFHDFIFFSKSRASEIVGNIRWNLISQSVALLVNPLDLLLCFLKR
jgi:hypothetical protein